MLYRKLTRTFSMGYANYIPNFKKVFPELNKLDSEELCDRLRKLNMEFYYEENTPVKFWVRITLPLAIVTFLVMLISLPFKFMLTGRWGYSMGKKNRIYNWFKALGWIDF